jgi:hypothetical protein
VPTSVGTLYFKHPVPGLAHEARVIKILACRRPELVTEVLVADDEGRMLMRDGGVQLSTLVDHELDLRYWEEALPLYAELQIDASGDVDELIAAGVPDYRIAVLPDLYEELLSEPELLGVERPDGLTGGEYRSLRALAQELRAACEELAAHRVPETIQDNDLSNGSIFLANGSYRFLDWGDAAVSHPFFTLTVTLRVIEYVHGLPPGSAEIERVRDAYVEPFTRFEPREVLVPLAVAARRTGQVSKALLRADEVRSGLYVDEPDAMAWAMRLLLDPEAWRTFED